MQDTGMWQSTCRACRAAVVRDSVASRYRHCVRFLLANRAHLNYAQSQKTWPKRRLAVKATCASMMYSFLMPQKIKIRWSGHLRMRLKAMDWTFGMTNSRSKLVIAFAVRLIPASREAALGSSSFRQRSSRKVGRNTNLMGL